MDDETRQRYLSNPHLKLDKKLSEQLKLKTQEVPSPDVAVELDEPVIPTAKQVVRRRRNAPHTPHKNKV